MPIFVIDLIKEYDYNDPSDYADEVELRDNTKCQGAGAPLRDAAGKVILPKTDLKSTIFQIKLKKHHDPDKN